MAPPTARRNELAARAWREAISLTEAWRRFRDWLLRTEPDNDGDAPYWCDGVHSSHTLWTGAGARRLVLFQKQHVMNAFLPDGRGTDRATRWGIATATAPFAPCALDVKLIRAHAQLLGGVPIGFVGDLDPHGLHTFGALRSGNLDAPDVGGRKLVVEWLGIDDAWLRRVRKTERPLTTRTIRMDWVEREYWGVIKRFAPDLHALVGDESFALLESGYTAESDAFVDVMPAELRARTRAPRGDARSRVSRPRVPKARPR
jgi:hypothetical protein